MAGTSSKTKVVTIRIAVEMAAEWETLAKAKGIGLAGYVLARAIRGGGQSSRSVTSVDGDASLQAEIATLKKALATAKAARPAKPVDLDALEKQFRAKWERERPVDAVATVRQPRAGILKDPVSGMLLGNPVLADPVPRAVRGEAIGFNLKSKGKKA